MTKEGFNSTPDSDGQLVDPYVRYLDGLKGWRNQVIDFQFIMSLGKRVSFAEFVERIEYAGTETDYAGFHVMDPNWYDEGQYNTGVIEPVLFGQLESHFRSQKLLDDDQHLDPIVHYSQNPSPNQPFGGLLAYKQQKGTKRANMVINVSGGEREDWGQFITCWLDEHSNIFSLSEDIGALEELRLIAQNTGKQEISSEQAWAEYEEREKVRRERKAED